MNQVVRTTDGPEIISCVADPDPGSGAFLIPDLGSQAHIFESLMTIFLIKKYCTVNFYDLAQIFSVGTIPSRYCSKIL